VGLFCCGKILQGRSKNGGGGEEGRVLGHILNITDRFTDSDSVSYSININVTSLYDLICLFESHCNFIGNCVIHVIALFGFFLPFISTAILSVYTDDIFLLVFTDGVNDGKFSR
jgi:hypothetical protein